MKNDKKKEDLRERCEHCHSRFNLNNKKQRDRHESKQCISKRR